MRVADDDGVRRITLDRPDDRNPITGERATALADRIAETSVESHDAVVVTGAGTAFSAGGDIAAMADRDETASEVGERLRSTFGRLAETVLDHPVPVVARVNGDAVGAGLSLVAVADLAHAAASARFGAAFVRVGLVPDTGGTFLLPRLVGLRAAKRLAMTGELVDAAEAADMGLVTDAVPDGDLDARVAETLDLLRERPTRTVGLVKRAVHETLGLEWRPALDREAEIGGEAAASAEHAEGVAAFLEDRDPDFPT